MVTNGLTIFISYAHADVEFAQRLRAELESRGVNVWVDEKDILVGDSISQKIEEGLTNCHYFCLVLSPTSMTRPWVQREYRAALTIQLSQGGEGIRILPLKISELSIPPLLQDIRFADFSKGFMAGLYDLCHAIELAIRIAPFVDMAATLKVDPEDLSSCFKSALKTQDMNILTPIWRSIVNGAHILNHELAESPYHLVSVDGIKRFLQRRDAGPGMVLLPPIEMRENVDTKLDNAFGFSYTLTMKGVEDLLECLGKWFNHVKSRRLYLVPNSIAWEDGWSERGQRVVFNVQTSLSNIGEKT